MGSEVYGNPWGMRQGMTLKEYTPPDVLAILHPYFHSFPPESSIFYFMMALLYIIGGFLSVAGNLVVLYTSLKFPSLQTPSNLLVMNLAFCDIMLMLTLVPESIYSFLMGGIWYFGDLACQIHAFCGSIFGYGQIATLVFISFDRYNVIVKGMRAKPLSYKKVAAELLFIWIFATGWATGPLVGYGGYALDGNMASCSYAFMDQTFTNVAYLVSVFCAAYALPLTTIMLCYFYIVKAVWVHEKNMREQAKKMNVTSLKTNAEDKKTSTEIRIAKVSMINITLWVIAWTPFAAVCLSGVLSKDQSFMTPKVASLPALFAKSSCFYNPLIYAISHPKYRLAMKQALPWLCVNERSQESDTDSTASEATQIKLQESKP